MKRDKGVCVHTEDLPEYVRRGLFRYKESKDEIDKFITGDIIKFSADNATPVIQQNNQIFNFMRH